MPAMTKCPNCGKTLKLKSEAAFGKKTACPQCSEPFTVRPYKKKQAKPVVEEPEYEDYEDTYGDYDDTAYDDYGGDDQYDDYEPAPRRSASSKSGSSRKNSKKKKKAAGLPPWLTYVAFGLAGVLVLGGLVGVVVTAVGGGGSNVIDLTWLPEDADLFMKIEPDELWNAPMLATVRDNETVKKMMEQAAQQGGVKIGMSDIDSVVMAGLGMSDTYQQQVGLLGNRIGRPTIAKKADARMIGVVRFKRDVTAADLGDDAESRKKDHGGKSYYSAPDNQAIYLADARTMLVGQEAQVTAAMDRGPTQPRVSRIDFVNPRHQILIVIAPPKLLDAEARSQIQSSSVPSASPALQKARKSLNDNTKAFAFGLSLTSNIEMEVQLQCFSSSEAETLKTDLDVALTELKTQFTASTGQAPPQFSDFVAIGKETIDSLGAKKSGDEVSVALQVPGRITTAVKDAIASNPLAAMMLQGMTQQFNQGATPPAGLGGTDANATSLNPAVGADQAQTGQPPSSSPEDFEAGVRQDQQNTLDTLNGVRGQIKKTTGALQDAVPGGK
jgi:hypothetical protein